MLTNILLMSIVPSLVYLIIFLLYKKEKKYCPTKIIVKKTAHKNKQSEM